MADEKDKVELEGKAEDELDEEITDEELRAAFRVDDEKGEPPVIKDEPKEKEPVAGEEEPDNAEKSRLGRRLKAIEEAEKKRDEMLQAILDRLDKPATKHTEAEDEEDPDIDLEEVARLEKLDRYREKKRQEAIGKYQAAYKKAVIAFKDEPEYEDAIALMKTNPEFDKIYSGDPARDAELNFNKAARAALRVGVKKVTEKKPPVHGDEQEADLATGLSGSQRKSVSAGTKHKLDEVSMRFVKSQGMSEEEIEEALAGEVPLQLTRSSK